MFPYVQNASRFAERYVCQAMVVFLFLLACLPIPREPRDRYVAQLGAYSVAASIFRPLLAARLHGTSVYNQSCQIRPIVFFFLFTVFYYFFFFLPSLRNLDSIEAIFSCRSISINEKARTPGTYAGSKTISFKQRSSLSCIESDLCSAESLNCFWCVVHCRSVMKDVAYRQK